MVSVACPRPGGDAGAGPLLPLCVALVGLLLSPDPAAAQDTPYFDDVTATHVPTDTTAHLLDIDLGDVNGDGRPDVFIGGWDTQVRLLLGRGGPSD